MKKIFRLLLILFVCFCLSYVFFGSSAVTALSDGGADRCSVLVVGLDDAYENTDVMMILSFDADSRSVSALQIPRDTLYIKEGKYTKLNSVYASARAGGESSEQAMSALRGVIERLFGIRLFGYLSVTTRQFSDLVDAIGGVEITLPDGVYLTISDLSGDAGTEPYRTGRMVLDGKEALAFVRYRAGYARGDLERMDMQKIFLSSLFETLKEKAGLKTAISLIGSVFSGVRTDLSYPAVVRMLIKHKEIIDDLKFSASTCPGEAVMHDGVSYYVLSRQGMEEMLRGVKDATGKFDPDGSLCDPEDPSIERIYKN